MKFFTLFSLFFLVITGVAQPPQGIAYQAVLRDAGGDILSSQDVTIRFTMHYISPNGTIEYRELHNTQTTDEGLVNLVIGMGTPIQGNFSQINWQAYAHYLQTEADLGNGFIDLGAQQLLSVPYALVAKEVYNMSIDQLSDVNFENPPTDGQVLQYLDIYGEFIPVDLPTPSQQLTYNGYTQQLGIEDGNSVDLNLWTRSGNSNIGNNAWLGTDDGYDLVFKTNEEERMRLGQDGDLIISDDEMSITYGNTTGANAPMIQMFASGTSNADRMVIGHSASNPLLGVHYSDSNDKFSFRDGTAHVLSVDLPNRFVGIGTYDPAHKLSVYDDFYPSLQLANIATGGNSGDGFTISLAGNSVYLENQELSGDIYLESKDDLFHKADDTQYFYTDNIPRMTITAGGYVGLGTTTPTEQLTSKTNNWAFRLENSGGAFWNFGVSNSQLEGTDGKFLISNSGSGLYSDFTIDSFGRVGIQNTSPQAILDVSGNIRSSDLADAQATGKRYVMVNANGELVPSSEDEEGYFYYSIPGSAFQPTHNGIDFTVTTVGDFEVIEGGLNNMIIAPVNLPNNANIEDITVYVYDNFADGNLTLSFLQRSFDSVGGSYWENSASTSGSPGYTTVVINPDYLTNPTDNTYGSYCIRAYVPQNEDPNGGIFIRGVKIRYKL
ncbi:MAG: hypothetical protein JNM00_06660 [Flavobacteriales bacterium]|nr:hypothetical protein [Flavobacteriales bacterium]